MMVAGSRRVAKTGIQIFLSVAKAPGMKVSIFKPIVLLLVAITIQLSKAFSIALFERAGSRNSCWLTAGFMVTNSNSDSLAFNGNDKVTVPPFEEDVLEYDHYNGVTLHLSRLDAADQVVFAEDLKQALDFWKAEGRKGIWIHVPTSKANLIPHCTDLGFEFHFVREQILILSQWLPDDVPSRLPFGPTHQIGVGIVVLHPSDPSKMLVVQEKSGPAAAYQLWKMPTGLLDPGEDIPDAAIRELKEETGLDGIMDGIVCFRQAHRPSSASDLFFVCRLILQDAQQEWQPQEDEIADIKWMSIEDYCGQDRWQDSPAYQSLNDSIRKASQVAQNAAGGQNPNGMIIHEQLELGFGRGTNSLFKSQL